MVWLWFVLYYPIMGSLIFLSNCVARRYPSGSVVRDRVDTALGCGVIGLPIAPIIAEAIYFAILALSNGSSWSSCGDAQAKAPWRSRKITTAAILTPWQDRGLKRRRSIVLGTRGRAPTTANHRTGPFSN